MSSLRLVNPGEEDAQVTVTGIDGDGLRTEEIRVTIPAKASRTLTAQELEAGGSDFEGSLGDSAGKWQLEIEADREIVAMSLLESPTGHGGLAEVGLGAVGEEHPEVVEEGRLVVLGGEHEVGAAAAEEVGELGCRSTGYRMWRCWRNWSR